MREHEAKPPSTEKHCIRIMSMRRRKSRALSLVEIKEDHPSKNKQAIHSQVAIARESATSLVTGSG